MPPLNLAFDLPRIHRASAILHRDETLDTHDAGLGVDGDLGELDAAQIVLGKRGVGHHPAEAAIIVAPTRESADLIGAQGRRRFAQTHATRCVVRHDDASAAHEQIFDGDAEMRRNRRRTASA